MTTDEVLAADPKKILDGIANTIKASIQAEHALAAIAQQANRRGNGQVILVPGQRPVPINGPSDKDMLAAVLQALHLVLQGQRLLSLAVINMQEGRTSGKVGDERGSQSPDDKQEGMELCGRISCAHARQAHSLVGVAGCILSGCNCDVFVPSGHYFPGSAPQGSQPPRTA